MLCVCGASCDGCKSLGAECSSDCNGIKGRVFWAKYIGSEVCPVYRCVEESRFKDCGDCPRLPCDIWNSLKDPGMSEDEHRKSIQERVKVLKGQRN